MWSGNFLSMKSFNSRTFIYKFAVIQFTLKSYDIRI